VDLDAAAATMGLTVHEYVSMGFHRQADNAAFPPPLNNPEGPLTDRQKSFLNDLGVLPHQFPSTYGEASKLIALRQPDFTAFKDGHDGQKPPTGRQRAALLRRDIDPAIIAGLTKAAAADLLGQDTSSAEPTSPQLDLLRKLGCTETPSTASEASDVIKSLLAVKNKPSAKQLALIKKLQPSVTAECLGRLTSAQACAMIAALLARANKKSGQKRKHAGNTDSGDKPEDNNDQDRADNSGTGAYG
jgi:hypothetical protein